MRRGKKLPETLATIRQDQAQGQAITLMLQDEARFGRISDVRRGWAPKPLRSICQAMLTHEYTDVHGAVDVKLPPYAPEPNPIEHVRGELREKYFHNRVFNSIDARGCHTWRSR